MPTMMELTNLAWLVPVPPLATGSTPVMAATLVLSEIGLTVTASVPQSIEPLIDHSDPA